MGVAVIKISDDWTDKERLMVCALIADAIESGLRHGRIEREKLRTIVYVAQESRSSLELNRFKILEDCKDEFPVAGPLQPRAVDSHGEGGWTES